jgi:general secretion pathway protein J
LREGVWRRWASPSVKRSFELQQAWLMSQQLIGNEDQQVRLLAGASEWQVYFYRGNAWSNAQSSAGVVVPQSPAPAASGALAPGVTSPGGIIVPRAALPNGVRLVINLGEFRLTRDVVLGPTQP